MAEMPVWCVALIGPRAAGTTTLARALATRLGWAPCDGDELIEQLVGRPAGEDLARVGEERFRLVEEEVTLEALQAGPPRVLALGGGAVTSAAVCDALTGAGILVVFVEADPAVLVERQRQASVDRPPLTPLPLEREVIEVLDRRRPVYERLAHLRLKSDSANVDACCEAILDKMKRR